MDRKVIFTVLGDPKPQPRSKNRVIPGKNGGRPIVMKYMPHDADDWRGAVERAALEALGGNPGAQRDQAVSIGMAFVFRRPKGHFGKKGLLVSAPKHHLKKPDFDNLIKSTQDALVQCGALFDDSAIVEAHITKDYCLDNEAPGCEITIEVLE